ncbi:MAG: T9SS type A sorting domain-containing protein [Bacteroidales bacterium]|nr:T9SS type A sorting domain-containing protein [Bacteroidales bacterium]
MKKSTILLMGILMGTIFVSRHLFSYSAVIADERPAGVEMAPVEIKVFPNPSDGRFQLTFEYSGMEKIHAKVYDITGKLVENITEDLVIVETSVSATVDLESPGSGIYFIRIEWGKTLLTKKIIIR